MTKNKIALPELKIQNDLDSLELAIFAQPIVNLHSSCDGCFPDFEILSRFYSDENLITPDKIFQNPENKSHLVSLDLIIFEETLKLFSEIIPKWSYGDNFSVAINVSENSIINYKHFIDKINTIFSKYDISDKSNFFLEVNEKATEGLTEFVKYAIESGFGISVDDIGTENFTIAKLRNSIIPYISDKSKLKVKIDQLFIKKLMSTKNIEKPIDEGFVKMILGVKDVYPQIRIVAEGIEDLETARYLKNLGINYGQGYYWRKPELFTSNYTQPKENLE